MGNRANDGKEFMVRLAEFIKYGNSVSAEDTDEILQHLGYNPDELGKKGQALATNAFARQMETEREGLKADRCAAQKTAAEYKPKLQPAASEIDAIINDIRSGKHGSAMKVLAFNHNFERATLEDKLSFLKDLGLLGKLFPKANKA